MRVRYLLLLLFPFIAEVASSQVQTGTPSFGSYSGGPDVINLANLNSHLTVPVRNKPGRETSFYYNLTYDTSVWTHIYVSGSQTWQPAQNWGWLAQTVVTTGKLTAEVQTNTCQQYNPL